MVYTESKLVTENYLLLKKDAHLLGKTWISMARWTFCWKIILPCMRKGAFEASFAFQDDSVYQG